MCGIIECTVDRFVDNTRHVDPCLLESSDTCAPVVFERYSCIEYRAAVLVSVALVASSVLPGIGARL